MHDPLYDDPPSRWELFKSAHGFTGKADVAFRVSERGSSVGAELLGGLFNFLSTLHLVIVNAELLSFAGLPRESAAASIALVSAIGTLLLGLTANVPFVVAPGLSLGAYAVYHLLIHLGASFATVNACVFIAGVLMAAVSAFNRVDWAIGLLPRSVKVGLILGFGMLLAFAGLQIAQLLALDPWTLVKAHTPPASAAFVALTAVVLSAALVHARVPGALLGGIAFVAVCAALGGAGAEAASAAAAAATGTAAAGPGATRDSMSPLSPSAAAAAADAEADAASGEPHHLTLLRLPWSRAVAGTVFQGLSLSTSLSGAVLVAAVVALVVAAGSDMVSAGCGLERACGLRVRRRTPMGTVDSGPSSRWLYLAPALATAAGAPFCLPPCVLATESASAPLRGARTGLAALVTAGLLGLAVFAAPAFASVPRLASAPIFLLTGATMLCHSSALDWRALSSSIPAALTALLLAFTADVALALAVGCAAAALLWVATGRFLSPSAAEAGAAAVEEGGVREYPGSPVVLPLSAMPVVAEGMGGRHRYYHHHHHQRAGDDSREGSGSLRPATASAGGPGAGANGSSNTSRTGSGSGRLHPMAGPAQQTQPYTRQHALVHAYPPIPAAGAGAGTGTGAGAGAGTTKPKGTARGAGPDEQPLLPQSGQHARRVLPDDIADTAAAAAAGTAAGGYGSSDSYDGGYLAGAGGAGAGAAGAGAGTGAVAGTGARKPRDKPSASAAGGGEEEDSDVGYHVVDTSLSGEAYL